MNSLRQIVMVSIALVTATSPCLYAQTRPRTTPNVAAMRSLPVRSDFANFTRPRHSPPNRLPLFPFGLFSGSLFPDNPFPAASPAATPSPLNLMEALSALGKSQEPAPSRSQPLLIELQGDRYVRISNGETIEGMQNYQQSTGAATQTIPPTISQKNRATVRTATPQNQFVTPAGAAKRQPRVELPPAVLIFRDGHTEEARDYTIVDGIIYARGDPYTDGYWTKKILLTTLNLSETLKSNQARGVHFVLPNAPNEVVTRP